MTPELPDASTHLAGTTPVALQISRTVSVLCSLDSYWLRVMTNKLLCLSTVINAVSLS